MRRALMLMILFFAAPKALGQSLDEFFDGERLQEVRIRMAPADWVAIHEKYMENGYYRCDFEWNGILLPNIGMRSRGSQSRSAIKPSIGLDFSRYLSTQRFLGLKTLVMRNLNQDASMLRERIAEGLFRRVGLPYSREAHARLYVNDEYVGVYLLVEPIDERLLKTRLGETTGYLYEVGDTQPFFKFEYRGSNPDNYLPVPFEAKTRTKELETSMGIVEMVRIVNEAPDTTFVQEVSKHIDLHAFLAHAATEQVLAQWDGLLGGSGMNNIYLYRRADGGGAMPLVWDQDGAFTDVHWSVFTETDENVLFRRAMKIPELKQRYVDSLRQAAEALGAEEGWMEREVVKVYNQIRAAVYEDPVRLCRVDGAPGGIGSCTIEMFEASVSDLRMFARQRASIVNSQLYEPTEPLRLANGSVKNLVSGLPVLVPGTLGFVSVRLPVTGTTYAGGMPLPKTLAGITLESLSGLVELLSVGPEGVVFVVPEKLRMGPESFRLQYGGQLTNWVMLHVGPTGGGVAGVVHADGRLLSATAPAKAGEALAAFVLGLWPTGMQSPETALVVKMGGKPVQLLWVGAAPGWIGLQQVNFVVPQGLLATGNALLEFVFEGETGCQMQTPVQ